MLQLPDLPEERNSGNADMVALLTALSQGLVTFKDVAVCFSQDQWSDLDPTQKEFYGEYVLEEDCGIVVSLCKEFRVFLECSEHRDLFPFGKLWRISGFRLYVIHFSYAHHTSETSFQGKGKRKCLESGWEHLIRKL